MVKKEQLELLKQKQLLEKNTTNKSIDEINKEIILSQYPNLNYEENYKTSRGKIVYIGDDYEMKVASEALGILSVSEDILSYVEQLDDRLIVHNGYLTGLDYVDATTGDITMYKVVELLDKLPAGSKILMLDEQTIQSETPTYNQCSETTYVGSGFEILDSNNNHMLYTCYFGDVANIGRPNMVDFTLLRRIAQGEEGPIDEIVTKFACDANGDGYFSMSDANKINEAIGSARRSYLYGDILLQNRPITLNLEFAF